LVEKFADEHRWNALVGTVDIDAQKTIAAKSDELEEFLND